MRERKLGEDIANWAVLPMLERLEGDNWQVNSVV